MLDSGLSSPYPSFIRRFRQGPVATRTGIAASVAHTALPTASHYQTPPTPAAMSPTGACGRWQALLPDQPICQTGQPTAQRQLQQRGPDDAARPTGPTTANAVPRPGGGRPRMTNDPAPGANEQNPASPDPVPAPAATGARQQEMPLAMVHAQPVLQIPQDLYIPPD